MNHASDHGFTIAGQLPGSGSTGDDAPAMLPKDAWLYAASWGSMMTNGDPGAVMYTFDENFTVDSEDHRAKVRAWIESECRPAVLARPGDYEPDELPKMDSFLLALAAAPLTADLMAAKAESQALADACDEFTAAYIEAALWDGVEYPEGHEFAGIDKDSSRAPEDIDAATLRDMIADCKRFLTPANVAAIEGAAKIGIRETGASPMSQAGHDFHFTRNGAGVGFWETSDWPKPFGDILDKAAKAFGEYDLYIGDDNRVHGGS